MSTDTSTSTSELLRDAQNFSLVLGGPLFQLLRRAHLSDDVLLMVRRLADPVIPRALNDRAQDNWRPLIAIAEVAGGSWPERVRAAALQLIDRQQDESAHGLMLLGDLHQMSLGSAERSIRSEALWESLEEQRARSA